MPVATPRAKCSPAKIRLPFPRTSRQPDGVLVTPQIALPLAATARLSRARRYASGKWTSPRKNRVGVFGRHSPSPRPVRRSQVADPASGCVAHRYETVSARPFWLSRDPIQEWGGVNLYGYVLNRPTSLIDPLGLTGGDSDAGLPQLLTPVVNPNVAPPGLAAWPILDTSKINLFPPKHAAEQYLKWGGVGKPNSKGESLDSKGNCWRFAANDPVEEGEEHFIDPPGWNANLQYGKGLQASSCKDLIDGLILNAGAQPLEEGNCCPKGFRRIKVQYADKIWNKVRKRWQRDYHFSRMFPDGAWLDKPGDTSPRDLSMVGGEAFTSEHYVNCGHLCLPNHVDTDKIAPPPPVSPRDPLMMQPGY